MKEEKTSFEDNMRTNCKRTTAALIFLMILATTKAPLSIPKIKSILNQKGNSEDLFTVNHLYSIAHNLYQAGLINYRFGDGKKGHISKYYELTTYGRKALPELINIYLNTDTLFHDYYDAIAKEVDFID